MALPGSRKSVLILGFFMALSINKVRWGVFGERVEWSLAGRALCPL